METEFSKGFTVYRNGSGPVYVVPHCGPALEIPTSRDDNSDTVASLAWDRTGGTLIVSAVSRKVAFGIDYHRTTPPKELAVKMWHKFLEEENLEGLQEYRSKYAWVAKDRKDHRHRLWMYNKFWNTVMNTGDFIVVVHRKFTRIKNFPSIIDMVTYGGVYRKDVEAAVERANEKHTKFLKSISTHYRGAILMEQARVVDRIKSVFLEFSLKNMRVEYKKNIMNDLKVMKEYADPKVFKRLEKEFNEDNFISAVKSALKTREMPRITTERIFKGMVIKNLLPMFEGKVVIGVESDAFINYWYPNQAAEIAVDIINSIKEAHKEHEEQE